MPGGTRSSSGSGSSSGSSSGSGSSSSSNSSRSDCEILRKRGWVSSEVLTNFTAIATHSCEIPLRGGVVA